MKITDVDVGRRYRVDLGTEARVCVLDKAKGGRLRVHIEAGSVWNGSSWVDAGAETTMLARDLTSTWAEYEKAHGHQGPPEPLTWSEEQAAEEARHMRAPVVDPDRLLPASYDSTSRPCEDAGDQLTAAESEAVWASTMADSRRRRRPGTGAGLLEGLPLAVARDLLAAFQALDGKRRSKTSQTRSRLPELVDGPYVFVAQEASDPSALTVAAVFERAAKTLEIAVDDADGGLYRTRYPTIDSLTPDDAAFATECQSTLLGAYEAGLAFRLPPHLADLVTIEIVDALGWAPIASGITSGRRLHQPGCHILREGRRTQLRHASVMPLWYFALHLCDDLCAVCGGPTLAVPRLAAHFMMASDVWRANGRGQIEPWQLACFARYFGAGVTVGLMTSPETRLVRALIDRFGGTDHGQNGWHLYNALVHSRPREGMTDEEFADYKQQAEAMRNDALDMAGQRRSGWGSADLNNLESAGAPHAARILFTLPGANRY